MLPVYEVCLQLARTNVTLADQECEMLIVYLKHFLPAVQQFSNVATLFEFFMLSHQY